MSAQIGLYFPYFHFPNDEWVKVAALYWDKMYRIVPYGIATERDTSVVKGFSKGQTPFIANIHPEEFYEDLHEIKLEFMKLINDHTDELLSYYGINKRKDWPDNEYTKKYAPNGANPKLAYIYSEKIEDELKELLLNSGLGTLRSDSGPDYQWIGMHPRLANVYMAALAERLAKRTQTNPVTPDNLNYFSVSGFTFERLSQVLLQHAKFTSNKLCKDEIASRLANIAFRAVMPKDIQNVPLEKIQKLRENYPRDFSEFQNFVQKVVVDIPKVKEIEAEAFVNDYLEAEFRKTIQPRMDELNDALKSLGINTISTVLNIEAKVPRTSPEVEVTDRTLNNLIFGATATIAIGLLKIFSDERKVVQKDVKKSDVAFLLQVRDDLTPSKSLELSHAQFSKVLESIVARKDSSGYHGILPGDDTTDAPPPDM